MPATPSTISLPLSGNAQIDSITHGYKWNLDGSRTIAWATAAGFGGEQWVSLPKYVEALSQVFASYAQFINVKFTYVGHYANPAQAAQVSQITVSQDKVGLFNEKNAIATGYFPTISNDKYYSGQAGDIYLNYLSPATYLWDYDPGTQGFALLLHEVGHTLGLKHPHDSGGTGRPTFSSLGISKFDTDSVTVMSYNDSYSAITSAFNPATPMAVDALGLMYLYGPNQKTNSGNSVHSLFMTNTYQTVWDASGLNTISASRAPEGWTINLSYGINTTLGIQIGRAVPTSELARSAPLTQYWFLGDYEKVQGSNYADNITGNPQDNSFHPDGGDDIIDGLGGYDVVWHGAKLANYTVTKSGSTVIVEDRIGVEGKDTFTNIEALYFHDAAIVYHGGAMTGSAYRLYKAAFNRTPDQGGLDYWVDQLVYRDRPLLDVSRGFVNSSEFKSTYGENPTPEQIVDRFYRNVLGRAGEPGGFTYWTDQLKAGQEIAAVLNGFSDSPENINNLVGVFSNGVLVNYL